MDCKRFEHLLLTQGARPERWDEASRAQVPPLLERSGEARALLAAYQAIDGAMDAMHAPAADAGLAQRILTRAYAVTPAPSFAATLESFLDEIVYALRSRFLRPAMIGALGAMVMGMMTGMLYPSDAKATSSLHKLLTRDRVESLML